jgi:hypothetical protein
MDTTTSNITANKVFGMMVENTGISILDSGGDNGRNWQRNQGLTLEALLASPKATWTRGDWEYTEVSTFHYLLDMASHTRLAELLDKSYEAYSKASTDSHYEDAYNWAEMLGGKVTGGENTYNYENQLSQVIQWNEVTFTPSELLARIGDPLTPEELAELEELVYEAGMGDNGFTIGLVQVHGGADVRGGYTRPVVFELAEGFGLGTEYELNCKPCNASWTVYSGETIDNETGGAAEAFDEGDGCPKCKGDLEAYASRD